jgi:hypothetical protein
MRRLVASIAFCCSLAVPASAAAAGPFYASPGGSGTLCTQMSRCSLTEALSQASAGEVVSLAGGTYTLTGMLALNEVIAGENPAAKPLLTNSAGHTILTGGSASGLRDVRVVTSGLGAAATAVNVNGGRLDRVEVVASGSSTPIAAALIGGATAADSVLTASGGTAAAFVTGGSGALVRNVTAVATGTNARGHFTNGGFMSPGTQTVTVQNSIVLGVSNGFQFTGEAGKSIVVNADRTHFTTPNSVGTNATFNGTSTGGAPLFAGSGDFHQLASSPTRDAGGAVPGLSATDFEGQARNQGVAPDIGADEFDLPKGFAHDPKPAKKCKKTRKKKGKGRAAAKKKKCKKKRKKK